MFTADLRHKDSLVKDRWEQVDTYFRGKQTRFRNGRGDRDRWKADHKTNHIYAFYNAMMAVLMRDTMSTDVSARYPNEALFEAARSLQREILRIYRDNEFPERTEELLHSGTLYGAAFWKPTWDWRMNDGVGGIRLDTVSAKNIAKQPGKVRMRDCAYVWEYHDLDILSLLTLYPEKRDQIMLLFKPGDDRARMGDTLRRSEEGTHTDGTGLTMYHDMMSDKKMDRIRVVEAWMTDPEVVERFGFVIDTQGGKNKVVQRKREFKVYPTGRYIRFAGNCIFEDRPNQFPGFPYVEYINASIDGAEWSMGELDQLVPIQKNIDLRNNQLTDGLNRSVTGGKVLLGHGSGLNVDEWTNDPKNYAIPATDVNQVKELNGPRVPGEAFADMVRLRDDFDRISGFPEFLKDLGDSGRSGYAIEQMSELVHGRLKLKSFSLETSGRELAKQVTRLIGLFYIRGVHTQFEDDLVGVKPELFEYHIRAGLNLPLSRRSQEQFAMQLLDKTAPLGNPQLYGALLMSIVENSDLENKEALVAKMHEALAVQPTAPPETPALQMVQG